MILEILLNKDDSLDIFIIILLSKIIIKDINFNRKNIFCCLIYNEALNKKIVENNERIKGIIEFFICLFKSI